MEKESQIPGKIKSLLEPACQIARLDTGNGRVYYDIAAANESLRHYFYGVTSILDGALAKGYGYNKWLGDSLSYSHALDYAMEKADAGTLVHAIIDDLNAGITVDTDAGWYNERKDKTVPITDLNKTMVEAYIKFYQENSVDIVASEITLYNPKRYKNRHQEGYRYPFAGTADIVCKIPDKKGNLRLAIVDVKTGNEYPKSHELQLTAYKILYDSLHGSAFGDIDDLYCLYLKKTGNYKLVKYNYQPEVWYMVYDLFNYMISNKLGKMPVIKEKKQKPRYYSLDQSGEKTDGSNNRKETAI